MSDRNHEASVRLLTIPQAAVELNCSPRTIWRLIAAGELRLVRVYRAARVCRKSVESLISRGGTGAAS